MEEITDDMILTASDSDFHEVNDNYTPHSRAVVQHYLKEGKFNIIYATIFFHSTNKGLPGEKCFCSSFFNRIIHI